jgi:two-component system, response regulator PdtaR
MEEPGRPSAAVLIVEDEPLIRMGAVDLIENAGFEVYEAGSADAAIALLELHKEIRLIFTDVDMPGSMDGLKLAHYVRGRWPPVKIIVTSGHIKVTEESLPAGAIFLPKPYDPAEIAHKVRELIPA